ncbi:MAG: VOC family protein [Gammaproteobacteria bacterium]|jgi:catechol 2,3-dioxygenase-like lactoylglutathione lyase family enzyme|nr:VOC family protein [Gammaproteobacteria bacterium]
MTASAPAGTRFQRANFVVSDLERSLLLYRDILGMQVEFSKDSPDDSYSYAVFGIDRSVALGFAVLSTASQPRVMALTELRDAELPPPALPRRAAIVLHVDDIDQVVAGCAAAGLHVFPEDRLETHDGRVGREVGLLDADGNLVVVYHLEATA